MADPRRPVREQPCEGGHSVGERGGLVLVGAGIEDEGVDLRVLEDVGVIVE